MFQELRIKNRVIRVQDRQSTPVWPLLSREATSLPSAGLSLTCAGCRHIFKPVAV